MLNNMFLIIYPFILLLTMSYNLSLKEQIIKLNINKFQLISFLLVYFLIFALFMFKFFIKNGNFDLVALIIGSIEIILLQVPPILLKISHNLYSIMYGQIQLTIFMFGTLLTLYIVMFIMYYQRYCEIKKKVQDI